MSSTVYFYIDFLFLVDAAPPYPCEAYTEDHHDEGIPSAPLLSSIVDLSAEDSAPGKKLRRFL